MKEIQYLEIIKNTLQDSSFLGDDCAFLEEFGLYITQDTLVENVHFSMKTTSAKELGRKAAAVNLSDLAAAASKPLYMSVSLSLPDSVNETFVKEFYKGLDDICQKYNVRVIGGDLTGSDSVMISITAIGKKITKYDVSRKNAKIGGIVVVTGSHGESAAGLKLLPKFSEFTKKHLSPEPRIEEGLMLANSTVSDFAMMDSSDGLGDALFKLAKDSGKTIEVDFSKIPYNPKLKKYFKNYKDLILWGGEDYELVACINEETFKKLDKSRFFEIGRVVEKAGNDYVIIKSKTEADEDETLFIDEYIFNTKSYKHFQETE